MEKQIIVTDLTRFSDNRVCLAGIVSATGEIIRPMPYLTQERCMSDGIKPGTKLLANFIPASDASAPHSEDHFCRNLRKSGVATSEEFLDVLNRTKFPSVANEFSVDLAPGQKVIKKEQNPCRSLITIEIAPANIVIVKDSYKPNTLKVNVIDESGKKFLYLPLADLGFFGHASIYMDDDRLSELNESVHSQQRVLLRIGLGRYYENPHSQDRGYWIQVNGIYTFPEYPKEIRSYE